MQITDDQAELRQYMVNHCALVTIPNSTFENRNRGLRRFNRTYSLTHHGFRGVNLHEAAKASLREPCSFMDSPSIMVVPPGPKFDYRIMLQGYERRKEQKHAKRKGKPITYAQAITQVADIVERYIEDVALKTIDGTRRLEFKDLYVTELQQQGASVIIVLAYYDRSADHTPAPPPAQLQSSVAAPFMASSLPEHPNAYMPRPYAPYPMASARPRAQLLRRLTADCGIGRRQTTIRDAPYQRRATVPVISTPTYPAVVDDEASAGSWFPAPYPPVPTLPPSQPDVPYEVTSCGVYETQWAQDEGFPVPRQTFEPTAVVTEPGQFNLSFPALSPSNTPYRTSPTSYTGASGPFVLFDNGNDVMDGLTASMSRLGPLESNVYYSDYAY